MTTCQQQQRYIELNNESEQVLQMIIKNFEMKLRLENKKNNIDVYNNIISELKKDLENHRVVEKVEILDDNQENKDPQQEQQQQQQQEQQQHSEEEKEYDFEASTKQQQPLTQEEPNKKKRKTVEHEKPSKPSKPKEKKMNDIIKEINDVPILDTEEKEERTINDVEQENDLDYNDDHAHTQPMNDVIDDDAKEEEENTEIKEESLIPNEKKKIKNPRTCKHCGKLYVGNHYTVAVCKDTEPEKILIREGIITSKDIRRLEKKFNKTQQQQETDLNDETVEDS